MFGEIAKGLTRIGLVLNLLKILNLSDGLLDMGN